MSKKDDQDYLLLDWKSESIPLYAAIIPLPATASGIKKAAVPPVAIAIAATAAREPVPLTVFPRGVELDMGL